jgi:hypothetical protein
MTPLCFAFLAALAAATVVLGVLGPRAEAALPANGRSWELLTVNPPSSSRVTGLRPIRDDGERIIYAAAGPPLGSPSGAGVTYGASIRGPSGWFDVPVGIPYSGAFEEPISIVAPLLAVAFSEDEKTMLWLSSVPLTPGAPPEEDLALYRQLPDGTVQFIAKVGTGPTLFYEASNFLDISSDGSRVVFVTAEHLLPADAARTQGRSVYAWNGSTLKLVDVDSGGALLSTCGSRVPKANGMSASGDRVFITTSSACGEPEKVYLANLVAGGTTEISASQCTRVDCNAVSDVTFVGATPDGRFAYLTTAQQLTNADEDSGRDLYRYNVSTGGLSLLSGTSSPVTGEVSDQVFPSEGGERVYFAGNGEMLPGESTPGPKFLVADGSGLHLVARASISSETSLSADGRRVLFVTETRISPTDTDSQPDAYLYDAEAGTVTQLSKGPSGGNGELAVRIEPAAPINRHEFEYGDLRPYRAIDAAGDRAIFQTEESLVPEDINGVPDVYEWWNGQLGLATPGNQPQRSEIAGMSKDGRSIVFGTNASLVGRDDDGESRDLYSARLGGGFPEPVESPACDTASCPFPAGARITRPTPPSMIQSQGKKGGALRVIEVASKAKKGAIAVVVSVPAPGPVSGSIWTREKGKKVVLAQGSTRAKRAGKVQLKLKLKVSARSAPAGPEAATLTVNQGSAKASQAVKVSLR